MVEEWNWGLRKVVLVSLEEQPLRFVSDLLLAGEDYVAGLPPLRELVPPKAAWESFSHLLALHPVRSEGNGFLKGFESFIFLPVVNFNLFVVIHMVSEPGVWHLTCDGWPWSP